MAHGRNPQAGAWRRALLALDHVPKEHQKQWLEDWREIEFYGQWGSSTSQLYEETASMSRVLLWGGLWYYRHDGETKWSGPYATLVDVLMQAGWQAGGDKQWNWRRHFRPAKKLRGDAARLGVADPVADEPPPIEAEPARASDAAYGPPKPPLTSDPPPPLRGE